MVCNCSRRCAAFGQNVDGPAIFGTRAIARGTLASAPSSRIDIVTPSLERILDFCRASSVRYLTQGSGGRNLREHQGGAEHCWCCGGRLVVSQTRAVIGLNNSVEDAGRALWARLSVNAANARLRAARRATATAWGRTARLQEGFLLTRALRSRSHGDWRTYASQSGRVPRRSSGPPGSRR